MATEREPIVSDRHSTHVHDHGHGHGHGAGLGRWGGVDWGAILASVFAGLAITTLLMAIGAAIGVTVTDEQKNADTLGTALGIWALIATALGTFLGAYIGGAMMRWGARFSSLYHGVASWSFALVLSLWLGVSAATGLLGASLQAANAAASSNAVQPSDVEVGSLQAPQVNVNQVLESGSWYLVAGLIVSLALAIAGWFLGAKSNPLDESPSEVRA